VSSSGGGGGKGISTLVSPVGRKSFSSTPLPLFLSSSYHHHYYYYYYYYYQSVVVRGVGSSCAVGSSR